MRFCLACIGLFLLRCSVSTAVASDDKYTRESLKGIHGVYIAIAVTPDLEAAGLTRANIQTDIELKLRLAGIPVLSREDWLSTRGPTLFLNINALNRREDNSVWPFFISVSLLQRVTLERSPQVTLSATTWSDEQIGSVGSLNVREIRDNAKDSIDRFINAYLSMNPK